MAATGNNVQNTIYLERFLSIDELLTKISKEQWRQGVFFRYDNKNNTSLTFFNHYIEALGTVLRTKVDSQINMMVNRTTDPEAFFLLAQIIDRAKKPANTTEKALKVQITPEGYFLLPDAGLHAESFLNDLVVTCAKPNAKEPKYPEYEYPEYERNPQLYIDRSRPAPYTHLNDLVVTYAKPNAKEPKYPEYERNPQLYIERSRPTTYTSAYSGNETTIAETATTSTAVSLSINRVVNDDQKTGKDNINKNKP